MKISVLQMGESVQQEGECCSGRDAPAEKRTSDREKWMKRRRAMSRKAAYRFLLREILKAFPVLEKEYGGCRRTEAAVNQQSARS